MRPTFFAIRPTFTDPVHAVSAQGSDPITSAQLVDRDLLPGEKEADYTATAGRIVGVARPRDAIEEFLIRDVIDLTWEVLRLRRAKAGILRASMDMGVYDALEGVGYAFDDRDTLSDRWAAGDANARKEGRRHSRKGGTDAR